MDPFGDADVPLIKKAKRVRFFEDEGATRSSSYPDSVHRKRKVPYNKVKRWLLAKAKAGKWEELGDFKEKYKLTDQDIIKFYNEYGAELIKAAYTYKTLDFLVFLTGSIPKECVKKVLSDDDFSCLKLFAKMQPALVKLGSYNDTSSQRRAVQLALLMCMDAEIITNFFRANGDSLPPAVHVEYQKALQCPTDGSMLKSFL